MVRERALDRAAASIRGAFSVDLETGTTSDYAEEDKDILTTIGFRPYRTDGPVKYSAEKCQLFRHLLK
jgi:Phage polarity suppression protein (Psu).